ncbi:MAG: peptidylprolyl isomerase [Planctomycetes bacterium]|nr:peptidylprolyl isomerase [Planctomycetota bacterium]
MSEIRTSVAALVIVAFVSGIAWPQAESGKAAEALLARFAEYQEQQRTSGALALELRAAQERYLEARATLRGFRAGKSKAKLKAARVQIDALEAELVASRRAYEDQARGDLGRRYRARKAELDSTLRSLAAGVGKLLRAQDDLRLRRVRAALFVDKGHFSLAERDLAKVLAKNADDAVALTLRGRCREAKGLTGEALADYRRTLELEPSDERRLRGAVAAFWMNEFTLARQLRDEVKSLTGQTAQLQVDYGWYLKKPLLEEAEKRWKREQAFRAADEKRGDLPRIELKTTRGVIVLELFEDQAPNTVANFVELVEGGFYDGLPWHRVQPLRLAASGKPKEGKKDPAGPGYSIEGEARLGHARHHFRGSVGCLIRGPGRRGGSQFYLLLRPDSDLDGQCTVFGRIVEGVAVLARLGQDDLLERARVTRKRDHPYKSKKVPLR